MRRLIEGQLYEIIKEGARLSVLVDKSRNGYESLSLEVGDIIEFVYTSKDLDGYIKDFFLYENDIGVFYPNVSEGMWDRADESYF